MPPSRIPLDRRPWPAVSVDAPFSTRHLMSLPPESIAIILALLSAVLFATGVVVTQLGLKYISPMSGAAISKAESPTAASMSAYVADAPLKSIDPGRVTIASNRSRGTGGSGARMPSAFCHRCMPAAPMDTGSARPGFSETATGGRRLLCASRSARSKPSEQRRDAVH